MQLGGRLNTVHVYLSDAALQATAEDGRPVRLREEFGTTIRCWSSSSWRSTASYGTGSPAEAPMRTSSRS